MAGSWDLFDRVDYTALSESSPRNRPIDTLQIHHATMTSLSGLIDLMQPGGRQVSANGAMGNDGDLVEVVRTVDRRAYTSASAFDNQSLAVEVCNTTLSPSWGISEASRIRLARLAVGMYRNRILGGFHRGIGGIIGHYEVPGTYATACPGPDMNLDHIAALARQFYDAGDPGTAGWSTPTPIPKDLGELEMLIYANVDTNVWKAGVPFGGVWVDVPAGQGDAWVAASGHDLVRVNSAQFGIAAALCRQKANSDVHVYAPVEGGSWRLVGPGVNYAIASGQQAIFEGTFGSRIVVSRADLDLLIAALDPA